MSRRNKAGYLIWTALGTYLAWIGIRLVMQAVNIRPSDMVFTCVMGGLFIIIGISYAIYNLKKFLNIRKTEKGPSGMEEPETEENTAEEAPRAAVMPTIIQDTQEMPVMTEDEPADAPEVKHEAAEEEKGSEKKEGEQPVPEGDQDNRQEESEEEKDEGQDIQEEPSAEAVQEEIEKDYEEK